MKKMYAILAVLLATLSVTAQKERIELKLILRDGNIISGTSTSITTVTLNTDYGTLNVPIKNVSALELGITPDNGNKSKVIALVKQMADPAEEKRQAAYDELVKLPVGCIPILNDYIYGSEYQASEFTDYTPESALTEMKTTYGVDDAANSKDLVTIDYQYNMGGVFAFKTISLKTEYGVLEVPKEKIDQIEVSYFDESNGDKSYKLLANKNISGNEDGGWLNTGIKVKSGQKINITASGECKLESLSGNTYTPDGNKDNSDYESEYESTYPSYGQLVYKIGDDGETLKAGSKYNGTAKESGVIYLAIYETVYNSANTGSYSVKLNVK